MSPEKTRYQDILKREFESRSARNAAYSLRAYARDMGLSPSSLSLVLNGKQGLSPAKAARIAQRLGLNAVETEYFLDLVGSVHARSLVQRKTSQARLQSHAGKSLGLDAFQAMSDWYHFAILELTEIEGFRSDPDWIARRLGISRKATRLAIERLKRLELLEECDGRLRQTEAFLATPTGIPSEALRKFHQQILAKAEQALLTQPVARREFSAIVLPLKREDLAWARDQIRDFRRGLMRRLEANPRKDSVYCLSIQLFDLLNEENPK